MFCRAAVLRIDRMEFCLQSDSLANPAACEALPHGRTYWECARCCGSEDPLYRTAIPQPGSGRYRSSTERHRLFRNDHDRPITFDVGEFKFHGSVVDVLIRDPLAAVIPQSMFEMVTTPRSECKSLMSLLKALGSVIIEQL